MKQYSCYLFDADGTLMDTSELIYQSYRYVISRYKGKVYLCNRDIILFMTNKNNKEKDPRTHTIIGAAMEVLKGYGPRFFGSHLNKTTIGIQSY